MQTYKYTLITLILSLILPALSASADTYPKREIRAAWVTVAWNNDWPSSNTASTATQKAEVETYLNLMKENGFNAVFLHVRGMSDRIYKLNSYNGITINEPWSSYISGKRGTDPGWDPLAYWIEQAHTRGIELHAWLNPYRYGNSVTSTKIPIPSETDYPLGFTTTEDNNTINAGLIISYLKSEQQSDGSTKYTRSFIFNPALDAVKTRIKNICQVLTYNYNIDGIVFDDYFYPEGIGNEGSEAQDYQNYTDYVKNGGTMEIGDWRRNNVNDMVSQVYNAIKAIKPYVKFGIAPAGVAYKGIIDSDNCPSISKYFNEFNPEQKNMPSDWQYDGIFSDPIAWLREGTIDYISPQLYWKTNHTTNKFKPLSYWWSEVANIFKRHYYASHTTDYLHSWSSDSEANNTEANWDEMVQQIQDLRSSTIDNNIGSILYSSRDITGRRHSGLGEHLYKNVYQKKAIVPATTWYTTSDPGKPQNLKLTSGTLSWTAATMSDGTVSDIGMRYAVYAIPLSVGIPDARSSVHTNDGGFKAEYLVDLTYTSSYDVSSYPKSSYWHAVTIVDRYGNEWEAATLNAPLLGDASISLSTPANNSTLTFDDNAIFSWTSDGNKFNFQLSTSSDFSTTIIDQETTAKSITLSTADFADGATYYWRVQASRESYNSVWSETRTFTMETRPSIDITLLTPKYATVIDAESETFTWIGIDGATYTIEISESSKFTNPIITETTTGNSYTLDVTRLAANKNYYWRVSATKDGYIPATAAYWYFTTPKKENATVDGITIEKLWEQSKYNPDYSPDGNFPDQLSEENCKSPRSMAVYYGNVYVLERTSDTACSLLMFDGETGEYIKTIALTGDIYSHSNGTIEGWAHKPGNGIFSDGAGNLYINCLNVTTEAKPLTICSVNLKDGSTTRIFESTLTSIRHRIDYANAFGDISTTGGQIWAATNDNLVYRWTRTSSGWTMEETTITEFYPNSATALGTAPSIQPISTTQFIVDGASTHPTLYTFNSGGNAILNSSFADNPSIQPTNASFNGTYSITIGKTPIFIYVDDNHNGNGNENGHSFSIVANKENYDFSQFQFMKSVPENKLGKTNHSWALDQPVAINNADGSVTVFLYAPNNGLAAYKLRLPVLNAPILVSPQNGAKANDAEQTFSWEGEEGATYTFTISENSTFTAIKTNVTTTSKSYTVPMTSLKTSTTYYWRVSATKAGYTDSEPSETWTFVSPDKPTFARPELYAPADGKVINSDISFVASKVTADEINQYLEISTDPSFSEESIIIKYNDGVVTEAETTGRLWLQYTVPVSILGNKEYYWRVRAEDPSGQLDDGISETRIIYVLNEQDNYTDSYAMAREDAEYELKNNIRFTNNWIRSTSYVNGKHVENGNNIEDSNDIAIGTGTASRGFCVRPDVNGDQNGKDIIYITYRDNQKSYFIRFDAATGEKLDEVPGVLISGDVIACTYPNNGVFLDDELNICIYNMCLPSENAPTQELQVCTVDPKTFVATERFNVSLTNQRIDHVRAIGDVANKDFKLFGVVGSSGIIYRWTVLGDNIKPETMTVTSFYPKNSKHFGSNIMIFPINNDNDEDKDYFFVDGASTHFTLYKWTQTTQISDFSTFSEDATSTNTNTTGGTYFIHNGTPYIIYPHAGYTTTNFQFNITSLTSLDNFSGAARLQTVPQDNGAFPGTNQGGSTWCALADYLPKKRKSDEMNELRIKSRSNNTNSTIIYTYVPGSGLASYSMTNHIVTGADDIDESNTPQITIKDGKIYFGTTVKEATLYSVAGQIIARTTDAPDMDAPTQGVYVLAIDINGIATTHKIIIK